MTTRSAGLKRGVCAGARVLVGAAWLSLCACATYSDKTMVVRDAAAAGNLDLGVRELNRAMKTRDGELPQRWKRNTGLVVLERGTVLHAQGQWQASARDMEAAERELELLDISKDGLGKIGRYIYSDSSAKYKTPPTERLALNALNMLNYLARGDLGGARVEAKRFTTMREYLKQSDPDRAQLAFGSYLAAFTFDRLGEYDAAARHYDDALQVRELAGLRGPLARLGTHTSYRTPRLAPYMDLAGLQDNATPTPGPTGVPSEILVVVNTGRVPYKEPRRIPIGAAIGVAGAYFTGDTTLLEHSAMKVVVYPELVAPGNVYTAAAVQVDGRAMRVEMVSDLGAATVSEFEDLKPRIIASAITRMIARGVAAEAARGAVSEGPVLSLLTALAVEGAMVALDKPDTRSWTLLPDKIHMGRVSVPAGKHTIVVTLHGENGQREQRSIDVDVAEHGFAVVDVTTLR